MLCIRGRATACLFIKVKECQTYTHLHFLRFENFNGNVSESSWLLLIFLKDAFSFHCRQKKSTIVIVITEEKHFREINRQPETKKLSHLSSKEGYNPIKS